MNKRSKGKGQRPVEAQTPLLRGQQAGEAEPPTQPLPTISRLVFEGFLHRYQLSMLEVAQAAGVRLLTIWRVMHDLPISEQQAVQVYAALERLAGVPYRGRIRLHAEENARGCGPRSSASR